METITACENVCRDFSVLISPEVFQGLLTLAAAFVAGLFARHIATNVYPVQKEKDRDLKIDEEKREIFRDYLKSVERMLNFNVLGGEREQVEAILVCKGCLNEVMLFSKRETAQLMLDLFLEAEKLAIHILTEGKLYDVDGNLLVNSVRQKFEASMNAARLELRQTDNLQGVGITIVDRK
ncbi:hypothetical protein B6V73_13185 [Thioclava sp. JM3]|uniref:hypothetical protein n=1 Tax=Thioclava sp. JM3 TaxID=1973004 RepID=UPI000B5398D4|nr:hypothetical protein [Thioclava sp. JM3]OWY16131.1 hypothetical protein B6V73_13185 [Thioclava sp. JM3]